MGLHGITPETVKVVGGEPSVEVAGGGIADAASELAAVADVAGNDSVSEAGFGNDVGACGEAGVSGTDAQVAFEGAAVAEGILGEGRGGGEEGESSGEPARGEQE